MADGIHILSTDVMINIIETRMPRVGRALTLVLSLTVALATWLAALTAIAFCGGKVLRNLVIPSIVWVHDLIIEIGSGWPAWPSVQGVHLPNRYLRGLLLVESLSETLYRVTRYVFGMIDVLWCGMLHDFDHHIHTWKTFQATNELIQELGSQTSEALVKLTNMVDILAKRIERLEASQPNEP